ncbi:hypothetical protein ACXR0O_00990 [Verrucomicrobiota bacterium sgz303538]
MTLSPEQIRQFSIRKTDDRIEVAGVDGDGRAHLWDWPSGRKLATCDVLWDFGGKRFAGNGLGISFVGASYVRGVVEVRRWDGCEIQWQQKVSQPQSVFFENAGERLFVGLEQGRTLVFRSDGEKAGHLKGVTQVLADTTMGVLVETEDQVELRDRQNLTGTLWDAEKRSFAILATDYTADLCAVCYARVGVWVYAMKRAAEQHIGVPPSGGLPQRVGFLGGENSLGVLVDVMGERREVWEVNLSDCSWTLRFSLPWESGRGEFLGNAYVAHSRVIYDVATGAKTGELAG